MRAISESVLTASILIALVTLAALIFFVLPPLIVSSDEVTNAGERLKLQNDVRTTGVQLLAGAVLALGAFFTARTIRVNREGQITERFTRAIDQLGSDKLDVRLGGIYGLERIARDSRRDHEPIMEVLATFVREHARWVKPAPTPPPAKKAAKAERPAPPPADVQAVLNVLGRRNVAHEDEPFILDLSQVDLRSADLGEARLEGAMLVDAHLEHASLFNADLRGAVLIDAHLGDATLVEADLSGAVLMDADLRRASLWNANLEDALLEGANLRLADLTATNLNGADLERASLLAAKYDAETQWPKGFDAAAAGARVSDEDSDQGTRSADDAKKGHPSGRESGLTAAAAKMTDVGNEAPCKRKPPD